jgi:hypothetical protein
MFCSREELGESMIIGWSLPKTLSWRIEKLLEVVRESLVLP